MSNSTTPLTLPDWEAAARAVLPKQAYDYIRSGADDEITLDRNNSAFDSLWLRPRYLVDVSAVDLGIELFGERLSMPILLAPTALQTLAHAEGELATARAATRVDTIMVASTIASRGLDEIAAASAGPKWFQLYCASDRGITRALVESAEECGYRALCLTVDVPVLGHRVADVRNGFHLPPDAQPRNLLRFVDLETYGAADTGSALDRLTASLFDPALSWKDLEWLRSITELPILIKGILTAEDTKLAVQHGASGVIVSNHGGRQLDGVPSTIEVLPEIVEAADGLCPILIDSGIRRGTDVIKALALGAEAVLIGRPYVWGLAVDGEDGVVAVLEMLRTELIRAMTLLGAPSVAAIVPAMVERRRLWSR